MGRWVVAAMLLACGCGASVRDARPLDVAADPDTRPLDCTAPFPTRSTGSAPPFAGTVFVDPDVLRADEPTSFAGLVATGQANRVMFDRRTNSFNTVNAYLFDARFGATKHVEIQVNPEFSQAAAETEATFYAQAIGRIPGFLFRDLDTVWIHRGLYPFGGGNNNLLIHTEQGESYAASGFLEETFIHEGAHTSLDGRHATTARWQEAQTADLTFISEYARDNPTREDVAESLSLYLAVRFRSTRLDAQTAAQILAAIPARITYFDCLQLAMDPLP